MSEMRKPFWWLVIGVVWAVGGCGDGATIISSPEVTSTPMLPQPTATIRAAPTFVSTPTQTAVPPRRGEELLGESWEGRPITAHWFGNGPRKMVLVSNIHGGTEENTHRLALEIIAYFEEHLEEVPSEVTLWIIPTANPDGLAHGTRCNARGVDLNRNAYNDADSCPENDWASDTHTTESIIEGGGGEYPFSEVETQLLRDFLDDAEVAIFYHSMAGMIFVTSCSDHRASAELGGCLSEATGYAFPEEGWGSYPVTGAMVDYLAYRGVAAAEVELTNKVDTELDRNLDGVRAVMESVDEIVSVL